jgi:sodium transport system permease protein
MGVSAAHLSSVPLDVIDARAALLLFVIALGLLLGVGALLGVGGLLGIAATEWLAIGLPVLVAARAVGPPATVLQLRRPPPRALLGALLVGASAWIVLVCLVLPIQERLAPTPPELLRALEAVASGASLPLTLLAVAVTPAICEELLCRGVLLPALRGPLGRVGAVLASSILFGALHLSPYRFVPTFLLGVAFGSIALAARSVVPAILAHLVNNGAVVLAGHAAGAPLIALFHAYPVTSAAGAVTVLTIGLWLATSKG